MQNLQRRLRENPPRSLSQFITAFRELEQLATKATITGKQRIRVGLVTTFTTRGLKEVLFCRALEEGLLLEIYETPYGNAFQEILSPSSSLYRFSPEIIFFFPDLASIAGDQLLVGIVDPPADGQPWDKGKWGELKSQIESVLGHTSAVLIIHNFVPPTWTPFGIVEHKQENGLVEMVENLNQSLRLFAKGNSRVFMFDYRVFSMRHGTDRMVDPKMYYLADARLRFDLFPVLADAWIPYLRGLSGLFRKCLVLDLDNTLWGGIVGEDGLEGVRLGPTPDGRPFMEFQKHILGLFRRGVILAINSRNNPEDAWRVIRDHPSMVLREKHFAASRINWNDKISNMRSLAEELSIGLDALVFLDDDPMNREMIRSALPEVKVIDLPKDPSLYTQVMRNITVFDSLYLTAEDLDKGKLYADQRLRKQFQESATDVTQYLRGLEMSVTIEQATLFHVPRIAQLTQKTNQFNMTTRRYQVGEIENFSRNPEYGVFSVQVADKFGDNGVVGVVIFRLMEATLQIDTFLLSCRVIGRQIEDAILAFLAREAKRRGKNRIVGEFIATPKNTPARSFFESHGFQKSETGGPSEFWVLTGDREVPFPDFLHINEKVVS